MSILVKIVSGIDEGFLIIGLMGVIIVALCSFKKHNKSNAKTVEPSVWDESIEDV